MLICHGRMLDRAHHTSSPHRTRSAVASHAVRRRSQARPALRGAPLLASPPRRASHRAPRRVKLPCAEMAEPAPLSQDAPQQHGLEIALAWVGEGGEVGQHDTPRR